MRRIAIILVLGLMGVWGLATAITAGGVWTPTVQHTARAQSFTSPSGPGPYLLTMAASGPSFRSSLFVNVDAEPDASMIWDVPDTQGAFVPLTVTMRGEVNPRTWHLGAGEHELVLRGRERDLLIDRVGFVPFCGTLQDFTRIAASFGAVEGDPNYRSAADLNNDHIVNIGDFILIVPFFGLC